MTLNNFKTNGGTDLPIMNIKGKPYLQVAHRIVWFREEHPTWSIETEFLSITEKSSCAKAVIKDDQGRIISMAHKFENSIGFGDFIEKSETGAIGRALALIGYGTQFCADELDEGERLADSPVSKVAQPQPQKEFNAHAIVEKMKANQPAAVKAELNKPFVPTPYKFKEAQKQDTPLFDQGDVSL